MNPKTITIKLRKCELCEVRTSHFHHLYPANRGGKKTGSKSGVYLCPNHHNMANVLQIQIERLMRTRGCAPTELTPADFPDLEEILDESFKAVIPHLIAGYEIGEREYFTAIGFYSEADYE